MKSPVAVRCPLHRRVLSFMLACSFAVGAGRAAAQSDDAAEVHVPDELFPGPLRGGAAVATGVPFLAMGELSLGLSHRFALGALAGVTPRVYAIGARPRVLLVDGPSFRLSLVAPLLYYPKTHSLGGAPWMLVRPNLVFAPRVSKRVQLPLGAGLVVATTMARIARSRGVEDYSDGAGGFRGYESARPVTAGLWWTLSAGVSVALSERFSAFADAAFVFERLGLASDAWVGGVPVIATLGLSTRI